MDLGDANGDEHEMDGMDMSESQLILAELRGVREVNS
jgi:hypothetical protein